MPKTRTVITKTYSGSDLLELLREQNPGFTFKKGSKSLEKLTVVLSKIEEEPKPVAPKKPFDRSAWKPKKGDKVRFRSWDDMKAEFGLEVTRTYSVIPTQPYNFSREMNDLCGCHTTIDGIGVQSVQLLGVDSIYSYCLDMLEPIE